MAAALEHLKVTDLTKDEQDSAAECEEQLKTLKFIPSQAGYDVCDDPRGLQSASEKFIKAFAPWLKVQFSKKRHELQANLTSNQFGGKGSKLQAFRFDKPAKLPVSGSMLFIPTTTTGSPTISGQALKVGSYVQLTEDVFVQPRVYCLVFWAN